jgi:hypothetical protein
VYSQLRNGVDSCDVILNRRLSALRDRVPGTLVHSFHVMNQPDRVQKVC